MDTVVIFMYSKSGSHRLSMKSPSFNSDFKDAYDFIFFIKFKSNCNIFLVIEFNAYNARREQVCLKFCNRLWYVNLHTEAMPKCIAVHIPGATACSSHCWIHVLNGVLLICVCVCVHVWVCVHTCVLMDKASLATSAQWIVKPSHITRN